MSNDKREYKSPFDDKRIILIYIIVIIAILAGVTYALQSSSIAFNIGTAIVKIDEDAYGSNVFDSSNLDMVPILDSEVENRTNNVIKIDFTVGGNSNNNADKPIIYDIALVDLMLDCELVSTPYLKWKLVKNGTELSSGSFHYGFDTINNGRLVLTNIQEDLPNYSSTGNGYHNYSFYIWLSDSCQSENFLSCVNDTTAMNGVNGLLNRYFSGKIEVELYTGSKKALVRTPADSIPQNSCVTNYQQNDFVTKVMATNAMSDINIDFSQTSEASNTNGIYVRSGTENDTYPIYYYRGNVNNNLIFADTCWKVVRTTETGGLKLIYNGVPSNGQCNNTGSASQITTKAFNSSYNSPAYVGYMYSSPYEYSSQSMSSVTDTYVYGNDVTYSNGTYTLTDTITSSSWSSIYNGGLNSNHYTCLSTGTTCSSVYYIYYTYSSKAYYITLTNGKKIEDALVDMLGADDNNTANYNTTSSTIKGNNTTEGTLDYWYYTNIEQKGYGSYIEDTVWCNDRSISSLGGWNPDGGNTRTNYQLYFGAYDRVWTNASPSLSCSRNIDKFTVSDANGNGNLDYPVGLLTADEIMLAGADKNYTENTSYYLYSGSSYWAGSPVGFYSDVAGEALVDSDGGLGDGNVSNYGGVRPSVSLKPGFTLTGEGDGSVTNPYKVS